MWNIVLVLALNPESAAGPSGRLPDLSELRLQKCQPGRVMSYLAYECLAL